MIKYKSLVIATFVFLDRDSEVGYVTELLLNIISILLCAYG